MIRRTKPQDFIIWIAAILLFVLICPYFVWPYAGLFNWFVTLPLVVLFCLNIKKSNNGIIPFFAFSLLFLASYCSGQSFAGTIFILCDALVLFVDKSFLLRVYERFRVIFVFAISFSVFFYLLYLLGFPLPYHQIEPLNDLRPYKYLAYPFFVLDMMDTGRFCGMFDEPGVVGAFSFIILFIEKFNFKRKSNLIIALAGLLSLSVFFYIAFVFFYFYFRIIGNNLRSGIVSIVVGGLIAILLMQLPAVNERIISRVQWDQESNTLSGDDRASAGLILYVASIRGSSQYYLGQRYGSVVDDYRGSASLLNAILIYGLIVVILYFAFFYLFAIKRMGFGVTSFMYLIFMALLLYNRPSMFPFLYFYLYTVSLYSLEDYSKTKFLKKDRNNL